MSARLHYRPRFLEDFRRQQDYLVQQQRLDWLENFYRGLEEVEQQLARFPAIGAPIHEIEHYVLREWRLPRGLPYLVQYVHRKEKRIRDLWLVRLFHFDQRRESPDFRDLPPGE